jgi:nucleoid DNA-binding protein
MYMSKAKTAPKKSTVKAPSFSQQVADVADATGDTKANIKKILVAYQEYAVNYLKKSTSTELVLIDLVKVTKVVKPATAERQGINPFTKEKVTIPAKPERKVIKVRPRSKLKVVVG